MILDTIHDAIDQKKQISFTYNSYGTDFKLHPKREREYIVNPYQIVVNLNKYYLIGNYDKYDDVSHYRLDLMTNVMLTDKKCKSIKKVKGLENGLNLGDHMREHIYMYGGESIYVKFRARKDCMTEYVDWLGTNFKIMSEDETQIMDLRQSQCVI